MKVTVRNLDHITELVRTDLRNLNIWVYPNGVRGLGCCEAKHLTACSTTIMCAWFIYAKNTLAHAPYPMQSCDYLTCNTDTTIPSFSQPVSTNYWLRRVCAAC
ncbi:hypothetical protein CBL_06786 [Carabus blaptoides fortunei]